MTHDYRRHGTTTLFAALNTLNGQVIGTCMDKHRHQEWLRFLRLLEQHTPAGRQLHLIVDNYATHKHVKVQRCLNRHPRFHVHYTPASASWLNMAERFFRDLTVRRIGRGLFRSVERLEAAHQRLPCRTQPQPASIHLGGTTSSVSLSRRSRRLPSARARGECWGNYMVRVSPLVVAAGWPG